MKRIVVMTEFFPVSPDEGPTGGVEQRVSQLVSRLRGWDVRIICSHQPGQPRRHTYGSATVHRIGPTYPYSHGGDILRRLGFATAAWWKALTLPRVSVIEGSSFLSYLPAALAGIVRGVPRIATYHECWVGQWVRNKGVVTGVFGALWEWLSLIAGFDLIVAVSEATAAILRRHGIRNIVVVSNGVSVSSFKG
ncbi:MAG: glycosyltransferase, partial [Nanoarchaeota archaeon]